MNRLETTTGDRLVSGYHKLSLPVIPAYGNNSRIELSVQAVIGLQDFRFTQTAGLLETNRALDGAGGGGRDFLMVHI